jgi:hypothetical protein
MDAHHAEPSLGDDSFDVLRRAKSATKGPEGGSGNQAQVANRLSEMRRRVLGLSRSSLPSSSLEPQERAAVTNHIRETMQVDLDTDEGALRNLEDQNLLEHMESARQKLARYTQAMRALPTEGDLHIRYTNNMSRLSELVKGLNILESEAYDNGSVAGKRTQAVGSIRSGGTPRNCPQNPMQVVSKQMFGVLDFVHTESAKTSDECIRIAKVVKATRDDIFTLRREVEVTGDGYVALVKALSEERDQLRRLLTMNTKR